MTFEEVVDQAVAMLQRRGRMSYGLLKRQFELDDAALGDLKEELLYAHLQVEDDGRGLTWTNKGISTAETNSILSEPATQISTDEDRPIQDGPAHPDLSASDAQRRQLTVMFCDLVGSTSLSEQLDPEELLDVIRAYQTACTEVVRRFDGHTAQLLGDGLLVYFGYPLAHEDDAQRAVRTGLDMLSAMASLNTHLENNHGVQLSIRVGIHTGVVVVGKMGGDEHRENLALGDTPNLAARIQSFAEPDTVVISAATYRLIEGYFTCQPLGEQTLRGTSQALALHRVLEASGAQNRLDIVPRRHLTPLIGREQEVGLLVERWNQVNSGQGHVVLLSGEAGIGKSRLVQVLKEHVTQTPHTRWECRSSPYYQNTALYPLTDFFQHALQWHTEDSPETKLNKLEDTLSHYGLPLEESVPLLATLLSLEIAEHRYPALVLSPPQLRQQTLATILSFVLELAQRSPLLLILEDLHWVDPTTLELLDLLIDQVPTSQLFILLTCRPEFQPQWGNRSYLTQVTLTRLSHGQIEQMVQGLGNGKPFPEEVLQQIIDKTDGVPLVVEELTKSLLESGLVTEINGQYALMGPLSSLAIPATLHDSLMSRLDRLVSARSLAQLGSVIGRQFSYELVQAVSEFDPETLQEELSRLAGAEIVYQHGLPPQSPIRLNMR